MPFIHLNHKQNNKIGTCWRALPIGDLEKESFAAIWNNENIRRVRWQMLNNERPDECQACWLLEDNDSSSYREQTTLAGLEKEKKLAAKILPKLNEDTMTLPFRVPYVEIRFSNICNLQCRMCSPRFSVNWDKEWKNNKQLRSFIKAEDPKALSGYNSTSRVDLTGQKVKLKLLEFMKEAAPHLRYVMFGGGEPLLQPDHYQALEILKPYGKHITLEYTSNLTYLGNRKQDILKYWPSFKHIDLKISLDADPQIYFYIRQNSQTEWPEKNIKIIQESIDPEKIRICATCTTSVYNIERLPEAMNWFTSLGCWAHASLVSYPKFLSVHVLPPKLKQEINKKIDDFIANLDTALDWQSHPMWGSKDNRDKQKDLIKLYVGNCQNYMNGSNDERGWPIFLQFDDILSNKKNSILDIYPHWKKYI